MEQIKTEEECLAVLNNLSEQIKELTDYEKTLFEACRNVLEAKEEEIISFDLENLVDFAVLSTKYTDYADQIIACSDYINSVCEFEGDLVPNFYLTAIQAYGCLIPGE